MTALLLRIAGWLPYVIVSLPGFCDNIFSAFALDRTRRSSLLDSWKAIQLIVKDARHVYSDGVRNVYRKKGSYAKALEDFYSTSPTKIQDLLTLPYIREASGSLAQLHKMGIIGKRRIYIGTEWSNGSPVVAISSAYKPGMLERLIKYTN